MVAVLQKFLALISLTRPIEWSKTFGNMVIAALIASNFTTIDWQLFLIGFVAIGPLLWGGLYALNDWVDWEKDKLHNVKSKRPIPSGLVQPKAALIFSLLLILSAFIISFLMQNLLFIFCVIVMLVNQALYSMAPFNLKEIAVVDLVSGSLINPLFRFFSGWVLFQQNFNAPLLIILFVLGVQFGGYTLYRLSGREHEEKLKYRSSVVLLGERKLKIISYIGILVGGISFIIATLVGLLPLKFILLAIGSLLLLPLYWNALKDPEKMDIPSVYKLIYIHYILFIAGFILLSCF